MSEHKNRVVVGLSGGVDSSVTAALLLEQGYEVIGLFMRNWNDESVTINNECPWIDDANDALMVAQLLQIPFQVIDLSKEYKLRIVDYMFHEYEMGRTPNPDILCNREIKFDVFLKHALELGADFVATGHYCQKSSVEIDGAMHHQLIAGADKNKDQSYFLCQINQEQLSRILFPIGHLQKSEVRKLANKFQLPNSEKKDSQGLCFIGKVRLPDFLAQQLLPKEGDIVELPSILPVFQEKTNSILLSEYCSGYEFKINDGKKIGLHRGAHYYTIGQRKGLGIGGNDIPLFIVSLDAEKNTVYVAKGEDHPALNRRGLTILKKDVHWIDDMHAMKVGENRVYRARTRYRQPLDKATLTLTEDYLYIEFENLMKGIAPGQFTAWYEGDILMGSGMIYS